MRPIFLSVALALLAAGCGGTTTPTPPPPPVEDPPAITCPATQTIQLTSGTSIAAVYTPTVVNGRAPVALACTPPSGTVFGVGANTVQCTATDALQRTNSCAFTITVLAVVAPPTLGVTRFFAFGDSITRGEDGTNQIAPSTSVYPRVILPDAQTYPFVLTQLLAARYKTQSVIVTNQGKLSEAVTDPDTLGRFVSFTSGGQYDGALIMEGTNDLYKARNGTGNPNDVFDLAIAGLRTMVRDAKSRGIRPFLATIPPMDPSGFRGAVYGHEYVASFNDRIRTIAGLENVPLVDVHQAFGGNLSLLSADGVHPNPGGYQKIADTFFTAIKGAAEVKSTLSPSFRRR